MTPSSNHARLPAQILAEAADWFVQFRVGNVGIQARDAFNGWLCRSPDHIRAYLQIAQTYADVPALKDRGHFDLKELVARARAEASVVPMGLSSLSAEMVPQGRLRNGWKRPFLSLAAVIALAAVSLGGYFMLDAHREPTYETQTGEQRSLTLADGSTVSLNAQSRIRVHLSEHERRIDLLAGQALFQVAPDKHRPFIVRSQETTIRAVGTQFDVYQRKTGTTVTVLEGRVAVVSNALGIPNNGLNRSTAVENGESMSRESMRRTAAAAADSRAEEQTPNPGGEVYLSAGQRLTVAPGSAMEPEVAKPAEAMAWTQRRLVFEGALLTEVVEDFNRYNEKPLAIGGEGLDDFRISGTYSSTDPASLVRFLKAEPGVVVQEEADRIVIRRQ